MSGVKGRSGAPGRPKSDAHRRAIAGGVRGFWQSEAGLEEKERRREAARLERLRRRSIEADEAGKDADGR